MYDRAMGCQPDDGRLGAIPVGAAVAAVSNFLPSIFQGSDPVKDGQRKNRADGYYAGAMAGNLDDEARLRCMAGEVTPRAASLGILDELGGCSLAGGSTVGRQYAQLKVVELEARRAAGVAGGVLIGQSNIPATVGGTIQRAVTSPWVLGGAALLVAFAVFRRGRR